jgi:hypothetical protein
VRREETVDCEEVLVNKVWGSASPKLAIIRGRG